MNVTVNTAADPAAPTLARTLFMDKEERRGEERRRKSELTDQRERESPSSDECCCQRLMTLARWSLICRSNTIQNKNHRHINVKLYISLLYILLNIVSPYEFIVFNIADNKRPDNQYIINEWLSVKVFFFCDDVY